MKSAARNTLFSLLFGTIGLACSVEEASGPVPEPTLRRDRGGNPDCEINRHDRNRKGPIDFLCAIEIPGNPITSSAKGWVEQENGLYFLADASNTGVDVIDIRSHQFVGRVEGFAGAAAAGGGTATTNGPGPSSFVSAPKRGGWWGHHYEDRKRRGHGHGDEDRVLWVSDGNSTVRVVDMDRRRIVASINTAIPACDGGTETTHYCGRTNEIGYDPLHHIVLVSNPAPLTLGDQHVLGDGYATFISAKPPYRVLGRVRFPGAGNVEGHVWVPALRRFLLPIQPTAANQATRGTMYIAVIDPRKYIALSGDEVPVIEEEDKRVYFCPDIPGTVPTSTGNNNLQLGPRGHLLAQMCGRPIIMDARSGEILNVIAEVGTGDQDWFNPGDRNFYVSGGELRTGVPGVPTGTASLGVISARTGLWLQNIPNILGASPSAYARTNEIFTRVQVNAAIVTNPALDNSRCVVKGRGCVVIFHHVKKDMEDDGGDDGDES